MPRHFPIPPAINTPLMAFAALVSGFGIRSVWPDTIAAGIMALLGATVILLLATRGRTAAPVAARRESQERKHLEAIWKRAPMGILLLDPRDEDGVVRIIDCNKTACDMHGYTREEMIGQNIDMLEETPWGQWKDQWFAGLRKERILQGESKHRRKDGSVFPTEYFTSLVEMDGVEWVIGMDVDATARRAAETAMIQAKEEAELANRAKSEFLAVMSHEIRTPMNGIIGFTNLLYDTPLNAEQRDWLATIRTSGETLLTLINDILDFSKIESGKMEMNLQPTRVGRSVEEAVDLLWSKASEKQIELLVSIDQHLPDWVMTDVTRFRQIVLNLVGNAIKFTAQGEVEVTVEPIASLAENGDPQISVVVRDTGVGIPADRIDRLFKAFSQADSSTTREFGGTGLGLVISRRLGELLGGTVELVKTNHSGSTFRLIIAAPPCAAPEGAATKVFIDEESANLIGKRVMIVDDNETNCRILRNLIMRWKMVPEVFNEPQTALDRLRSGAPFDIALLDMMMPGMNGIELAGQILSDVTGHGLPLLLISSVGQDELRKLGDLSSFKSILHKPLRQSNLHDSMVNALGFSPTVPVRSAPEASRFDSAMASNHPLNVLVAEDNPINRKLIQRLLQRLGYEPELVVNGRECIELLHQKPFDVVLMDCQMPILDGYEATLRIRSGAAGADQRALPIIALTAAAMVGDRERCMHVGMNDYLTKPVQPEALIQILRTITSRT